MAWKRFRPSAPRSVCQSMYIGALISLLTPATGADPGIFDGGGGPNFGSERTVELFWGKLLFPHTPSHQWWLHVIIPWPLTVYLDSTCKGCTLGSSSSCVWLQRLYRFRQHQCQGHDVRAWARTWARTYVRTYIHTYIHTYINAYIHTYIQTLLELPSTGLFSHNKLTKLINNNNLN